MKKTKKQKPQSIGPAAVFDEVAYQKQRDEDARRHMRQESAMHAFKALISQDAHNSPVEYFAQRAVIMADAFVNEFFQKPEEKKVDPISELGTGVMTAAEGSLKKLGE